jgi:hypothetical protein
MVLMGLRDPKESLGYRDLRANRVSKEKLVYRAYRASQGHKETKV